MELVYLWVEDYKNIHKQGFNFSPRFECKFYDEYEKYIDENGEEKERLKDNCQLEIIEKKEDEYIKDFFGENINVTAIVGKNGSGKSSVAECIAFNHFSKLHNDKSIIFLYYDKVNNLFLIYSEKIENIKLEKKYFPLAEKFNYKYYHIDDKDYLFKIFYTSGKTWFDPRNERNQKDNIIYEIDISDYTLFEWYAQQIQDEYKHKLTSFTQIWFFSRTQNTLNGLRLFKSNIKLPKDLVKPKNVYITIDASFIKTDYANFIKNKFGNEYKGIFTKLAGLANTPYNSTIKDNEYKLKHILLQNIISKMNLEENDIKIDFENLAPNQYEQQDIEWHKKKIDEGWNSIKEKSELKKYRLDRLITLLAKKEKFDIKNNFDNIQEILDIYSIFLGYGEIDFLDFRYEPFLSSGGEQLINLISRIYIQIEEKIRIHPNDKFVLLILDEPDIYLHPNWQKQFIHTLISFLEKNYQDIQFHIIFTTHSPFLLSDISKQNIIFLDTYKKEDEEVKNEKQKIGNCKVLTHDEVLNKKQTFGANIHTLLSDSFFMEDGLIGEFAKNKIQEAIDFLNEKESSIEDAKSAKNIINIIGEPFLQMQLRKLYNTKFSNKVEIDKQIEELKRELKRLEDAKLKK